MDPNLPRLFNVSLLPDDSVYLCERIKWRKQKLNEILIQLRESMIQEENFQLSELLTVYHKVFSLEDGNKERQILLSSKLTREMASTKDKLFERYLLPQGKTS